MREARQVNIQFVAGTTEVSLTLPEGIVGECGLWKTVQFAAYERKCATEYAKGINRF